MVYSGNVLDRNSRRIITDAFVVVDKEAYLKLGGTIPANVEPYQPSYELTDQDWENIQGQNKVLDILIRRYPEKKYATLFITLFRKMINSGTLTEQKKAIYNQFLIHLFTIDKL
ncbi:MAG: hypothetical protein LBU27_02630 [Candidatus Peribacteria bacterium]|jgi:hypothetical protein|nr:hypothetical protein [Candidatus Peribacteria bacterium]